MYNRDRSPEVDDVEGMAAAATKQKNEAERSFIIESIVGKLLIMENNIHFSHHRPPARFQWMGGLLTL